MEELGEPTIGSERNPAYKYPRYVRPDPGIPEGWKQLESAFGENAKQAGQIFIRWSSPCGKLRSVSANKCITHHCEQHGLDAGEMLAEYQRLQKDPPEGSRFWWMQKKKEDKAEEARIEREKRGKLQAEVRERTIAAFHEKFGPLTGPMVHAFPFWSTRWAFRPMSGQAFVTYIDPDGREWQFLKELEIYLQLQLEKGEQGPGGVDIVKLVEAGRANADPELFGIGARTARETQGTYEVTADGASRVGSLEDLNAEAEKRREEREQSRAAKRARKLCFLVGQVEPDGPRQEGWATLQSQDDVRTALSEFRQLLKARGFSSETELVAIHGAPASLRYARRITGVYLQMSELFEGHHYYQKLLHAPKLGSGVCCDSVYILWNASDSRWQLTVRLKVGHPCIAYCSDAQERLEFVKSPWQVQGGLNDFREIELECSASP